MPEGQETGVESPQDFGTSVARWDAELRSAEKVCGDWRQDARRISERYSLESKRRGGDKSEFNILWSNVQTLGPALYGQEPIPVVQRRFRDRDAVARLASQMLERAIKSELEADERAGRSLDSVMRRATQDFLLEARGVGWVRYEPDIVEDQVIAESSPIDYLGGDEFLHSPKATWAEVAARGWVARRVDMTRQEGVNRFGEDFRNVPLKTVGAGHESSDMDEMEMEVIGRAAVWEIWDANTKRVIWISREWKERVLDEMEDPLKLDGFFPCPMPAFGTLGNSKLVPIPDYRQYSALAEELDSQTQRIDVLTSALRVAGIYDSSMEGLGTLLSDTGERNRLIGVTNMNALAAAGGSLANVVQYLPLDTIAQALIALYDARERTKQTLYEVSGIADVLRGVVDPREKLGQSNIKAQHAGQRIDARRRSVEQLALGLIRRKGEIIAEHYSPDTLRAISGFDQLPEIARILRQAEQIQAQVQQIPPDADPMQAQQMVQQAQMQAEQIRASVEAGFQQAIQLLKSERLRGFRIEMETNSTMLPDDDDEKQRRMEFLEATGSFLERSLPVAQQVPDFAPLIGEMLLFAVRGFRAGRQLETVFEETIENLTQQPPQPPPGEEGPDPNEQAAAEANLQATQAQSQAKVQEAQAKIAAIRAKSEADQQKAQADMALTQAETEARIMELQAELQKLKQESQIREREALVSVATSGNNS